MGSRLSATPATARPRRPATRPAATRPHRFPVRPALGSRRFGVRRPSLYQAKALHAAGFVAISCGRCARPLPEFSDPGDPGAAFQSFAPDACDPSSPAGSTPRSCRRAERARRRAAGVCGPTPLPVWFASSQVAIAPPCADPAARRWNFDSPEARLVLRASRPHGGGDLGDVGGARPSRHRRRPAAVTTRRSRDRRIGSSFAGAIAASGAARRRAASWLVWPGFGPRSRADYGGLIGSARSRRRARSPMAGSLAAPGAIGEEDRAHPGTAGVPMQGGDRHRAALASQ
jgi:hypothetical protein